MEVMSKDVRKTAAPVVDLADLLELWEWWLSQEYSLDLRVEETHQAKTITHHYVFGPCDHRAPAPGEHLIYNQDLKQLIASLRAGEALPGCLKPPQNGAIEARLFNQDLLYRLVPEANLKPMRLEVQSAAFHKGRIPNYVTFTRVERKWRLRSGHPNMWAIDTFEGVLEECLREVFLAANIAPHPYQDYIDANAEAHQQALAAPRQLPA
jgi:hypothetical protein